MCVVLFDEVRCLRYWWVFICDIVRFLLILFVEVLGWVVRVVEIWLRVFVLRFFGMFRCCWNVMIVLVVLIWCMMLWSLV